MKLFFLFYLTSNIYLIITIHFFNLLTFNLQTFSNSYPLTSKFQLPDFLTSYPYIYLLSLVGISNHDIDIWNWAGKPKPTSAHGVIFRDSAGVKHKAYLKKGPKNEIIVSAGALGSPQLLMLSGVGPRAHLKAHNITVVLDQPFVGKGMSDNPMNAVFVPSPVPVEISLLHVVGITSFGSYIEAASGENFAAGSPKKDYGMFSPKVLNIPLHIRL